MAKSRIKKVDVTVSSGAAPMPEPSSIPTGGNPSEDAVGGLVPNWDRNLVIEVAEGAVVERIDDMNWQAKILRRVERVAGGREAKHSLRWDGIGYYSSPGYAVRKLVQILATAQPGRVTIEEFADRIERLIGLMTPAVMAGERAKATAEAAELVRNPDDAKLLHARARKYAAGSEPKMVESTRARARELGV